MTEIDVADQGATAGETPSIFDGEGDWLLSYLINMANTGVSMGITLSVGGVLVSGVLIGGKEYLELFGKQFEGGLVKPDQDRSESAAPGLFSVFEQLYDYEPGQLPPPASYIHLKSAVFYTGNQEPLLGPTGALWRGRTKAVEGFILGSLSRSE